MIPKLRESILQWANRPAQDTEAKKPAPFLPTIDAFASAQIDSLDDICPKRTMRYDKIGVRRNASGLTLPSVYILKWWRRSFYKGLGG